MYSRYVYACECISSNEINAQFLKPTRLKMIEMLLIHMCGVDHITVERKTSTQ